MKVNLIRKFKWYIIGFILVAIMLSVSLSFASWDTASLKAKLSQGSSGAYNDMVKLLEDKYLSNGTEGQNNIADVGDIVSFGNYYQTAAATTKDPIRWIVVEKQVGTSGKQELTLLAEKVMAFGSFWGNWYHNGSSWVYATQANGSYYQNYSKSTVRAWLNSCYTGTDARNDAGTAFSASGAVAFRGFMNEAFTKDEQDYIISKTMSGMKGYGKDNNPSTPTEAYATITDKVWLPSWSEVYGTTTTSWGTTIDGSPSARFSYFSGTIYNPTSEESKKEPNKTLKGSTTAFASSAASNYTVSGISNANNWQNSTAGGDVWWWLRSPFPSGYNRALVVLPDGSGYNYGTDPSGGGVRPAVIVPVR